MDSDSSSAASSSVLTSAPGQRHKQKSRSLPPLLPSLTDIETKSPSPITRKHKSQLKNDKFHWCAHTMKQRDGLSVHYVFEYAVLKKQTVELIRRMVADQRGVGLPKQQIELAIEYKQFIEAYASKREEASAAAVTGMYLEIEDIDLREARGKPRWMYIGGIDPSDSEYDDPVDSEIRDAWHDEQCVRVDQEMNLWLEESERRGELYKLPRRDLERLLNKVIELAFEPTDWMTDSFDDGTDSDDDSMIDLSNPVLATAYDSNTIVITDIRDGGMHSEGRRRLIERALRTNTTPLEPVDGVELSHHERGETLSLRRSIRSVDWLERWQLYVIRFDDSVPKSYIKYLLARFTTMSDTEHESGGSILSGLSLFSRAFRLRRSVGLQKQLLPSERNQLGIGEVSAVLCGIHWRNCDAQLIREAMTNVGVKLRSITVDRRHGWADFQAYDSPAFAWLIGTKIPLGDQWQVYCCHSHRRFERPLIEVCGKCCRHFTSADIDCHKTQQCTDVALTCSLCGELGHHRMLCPLRFCPPRWKCVNCATANPDSTAHGSSQFDQCPTYIGKWQSQLDLKIEQERTAFQESRAADETRAARRRRRFKEAQSRVLHGRLMELLEAAAFRTRDVSVQVNDERMIEEATVVDSVCSGAAMSGSTAGKKRAFGQMNGIGTAVDDASNSTGADSTSKRVCLNHEA